VLVVTIGEAPTWSANAASSLNRALGRSATASASHPDHPPFYAIDGQSGSWWTAGDTPLPVSITVDLEAAYSISRIELYIELAYSGPSTHFVEFLTPSGEIKFSDHDASFTNENTPVGYVFSKTYTDPILNIRYVRITTTFNSR
jgi:hypothetical protein